ncbi:MAG: 30S ribosomal protein S12 methylthiotransferase RimO [Candidatus Lambdaproteobacteria bacterium]|nr:30S ribosomal protein S12 methylthiotransferase RimO [Candidatus Lambdaproteobacteria bacterium]
MPTAEMPRRLVYLETLGCAKNRVDSEIMLAALHRGGYGYTAEPAEAQVIVVNTCAFLTAASEESIERLLTLSDFKSAGRCEKLICAGCMSERYRESLLEEIPELDGLLGSSNFQEMPALLDDLYAGVPNARVRLQPKPHYAHLEHQERLQTTPAPYVYLKIAEGCSNMCSFCNIPFLRGYFSSRGIADIVEEQRRYVDAGIREINLISQDTSSYGVDRKDGAHLAALLRAMDAVPGDYWLRLFYAYPNTFGQAELDALADAAHIVPYLDMPFQHIADHVLKDMNRRIGEAQIRSKLEWLRARLPGLALRTTFITGFPGETADDHRRLLGFIAEGWFEHVGVFTYSHEDNIHSARLGDPVSAATKRARKAELLAAQQAVSARRNAGRVGRRLRVLVQGHAEETELLLQGRAAFQGPEVDGVVYINEGQAAAGAFHEVEIVEAHPYDLIGRIVQ